MEVRVNPNSLDVRCPKDPKQLIMVLNWHL